MTPLFASLARGSRDALRFLLEIGISANLCTLLSKTYDKYSRPPCGPVFDSKEHDLSRLIEKENQILLEFLLHSRKIDWDILVGARYVSRTPAPSTYPNFADDRNRTTLSHASESGYVEVVKLLLDIGGILPDEKSDTGRSPLSYAAQNGHYEVIKLLLNTNRVDENSKDGQGNTPLTYATMYGHPEVIKLLRKGSEADLTVWDGTTFIFDTI